MFHLQDSEYQLTILNYFYKKQKEYLTDNNLQIRKKDYLSTHYFQYLTEQYKTNKTKKISELFGIACDILTRHCLTHRKFLQYNLETKTDFYSYAIYRIFEYGLNCYDPQKGKAFVFMTSVINNAFVYLINEQNKSKKLQNKIINDKNDNCNVYSDVDVELRSESVEIDLYNIYDEKENIDKPIFFQELKKRYKNYSIKKTKLLLEDGPKFKRKYLEYDNFMEIKDGKGIFIEYIDINKHNVEYIPKSYYLNKMKLAREHKHQVFFVFSDIYLSTDIDDNFIWSKLDSIIEGIEFDYDSISNYYEINGDKVCDPMISYIPIGDYQYTEQHWYWLDDYKIRKIPMSQSDQEYKSLKEKNPKGSRIFDCGKIILK